MLSNVPAGLVLTPGELRHARFLDAHAAFRTACGLDMVEGGEGGTGGGGGGGAGGDGGTGGTGGTGAGGTGAGAGSGAGEQVPEGYAVDGQGRSLGYPAGKAWTDMTDAEQSKYWMHQSQKHEGRYKGLAGGRSFDEAKAALEAAAELQKQQQTPAEQALEKARTEGASAARTEANNKAAKAIFEGTLRSAKLADGKAALSDTDISDLIESLNVGRYINADGDIDTVGLTTFAARFTSTPGTGTQQQRRDFGGGQRNEGNAEAGAQANAQLARRHPSTQQNKT